MYFTPQIILHNRLFYINIVLSLDNGVRFVIAHVLILWSSSGNNCQWRSPQAINRAIRTKALDKIGLHNDVVIGLKKNIRNLKSKIAFIYPHFAQIKTSLPTHLFPPTELTSGNVLKFDDRSNLAASPSPASFSSLTVNISKLSASSAN